MRKAIIAFINILLFRLAELEGSEILGSLITLSVDGKHFRIFVGYNHRRNDDRDNNAEQNNQADHRKRIPEELPHTVFEEGNRF